MGRHSNRAPAVDEGRRPLYARILRLRHIQPGWILCFLYFEGIVALAVVLALVGFVTWWGVLVLPVTVAAMVKLNDVVAGRLTRAERARNKAARRAARPAGGEAPVSRDDATMLLPTTTAGRLRRPATPPPAKLPPRPSDPTGPAFEASTEPTAAGAITTGATSTGSGAPGSPVTAGSPTMARTPASGAAPGPSGVSPGRSGAVSGSSDAAAGSSGAVSGDAEPSTLGSPVLRPGPTGSATTRPTRPSATGVASTAIYTSSSDDPAAAQSDDELVDEPPGDLPPDQLEGFISDIQDDGVPLSPTEPPADKRGRSPRT
jgi:hypothetical protein